MSFDSQSFDSASFDQAPTPVSFTSTSFSNASFTTAAVTTITPPPLQGGGGKRNRFRAWIASLARDLKDFFKIRQRPPEPEDIEIPEPQPPQTTIILDSSPTESTKLETINDKWSIVASVPPPEARTEIIYPLILNPLTAPLIQTKVTLPRPTRQPTIIPPYRVGEGSHIESKVVGLTKPKNRSKTASTINTLMILLDIERQI